MQAVNEMRVRQLFGRLSIGDFSNLEVALMEAVKADQSVLLMTTEGSPNDGLWAEFVTYGWMERQPLPDILAPLQDLGLETRMYVIKPDGIAPIKLAFDNVAKWLNNAKSDEQARQAAEVKKSRFSFSGLFRGRKKNGYLQ